MQYIFILVILIKHCWTLNCTEQASPQPDEASGTLPILPPIKVGEKTYHVETFFTVSVKFMLEGKKTKKIFKKKKFYFRRTGTERFNFVPSIICG